MSRYVLRRLAVSALLIWLVLSLTFLILHLAPGDPVQRLINPRVPRVQAQRVLEIYGLDRPLPVQYLAWVRALVVERDLGVSFLFNRPVVWVLRENLPPTMLLGAAAFLLQYAFGIPLGIAAAIRQRRWPDHLVRAVSAAMSAVPTFWLGMMLILISSRVLGLLPAGGMTSPYAADWSTTRQFVDVLHHLILPATVLAAPLSAQVARLMRNGLLEEMNQDYVRSARARGLTPIRVLRHALRNSSAPLIQLGGLSAPMLLGGAVVVEHVFAWPGIGSLTISAIAARDYPLVLGTTVLTATAVVLGNFAADLAQAIVDPRVRVQ